MILSALLLAPALAGDREDLQSALLARAMGERQPAQDGLTRLVQDLAADDPLRGLALYWRASLEAERGALEDARKSLRECIRTGPTREDCIDLLGRLELELSAMTRVPTVWTFDEGHGLVNLWTQDYRGSTRLEARDGDAALVWNTRRDPSEPGTLLFAVRSGVGTPTRFVAKLLSPGQDAWVLPMFIDDAGELHRPAGDWKLSSGRMQRLDIDLREVPGLDPARLERVVLRDLTANNGSPSGITTLVLDDVGLR